jgi:ferredoxin
LAISRQLAERLNEQVMPLGLAVKHDLLQERRIGLVFPSYWFNAPRAVTELLPRLRIPKDAYVFIVIPCGAQAGNAIWTVRRMLAANGIEVAYSHKIRVPDNSALGFGRNPNEQLWKFQKYAPRLEQIKNDIAANENAHHWGSPDLLAALQTLSVFDNAIFKALRPKVNAEKCVGCGICAKVCSVGNISLTENHAHCGDKCEACLACVHFCPHQAVELGGKPTLKERQYHHPEVEMKDMIV